jgi:hypothetical protein
LFSAGGAMSRGGARAGAVSTLGGESYGFYPPVGCQIGHSSSRHNVRALCPPPIELPPERARSASPAPTWRLVHVNPPACRLMPPRRLSARQARLPP